jgi:hypothetical protein
MTPWKEVYLQADKVFRIAKAHNIALDTFTLAQRLKLVGLRDGWDAMLQEKVCARM